jgi:hypothetical protein
VIVSQIPFAVRRYKLGRLNAAIQTINSNRRSLPPQSNFNEYKGVMHVHSFLGGHSAGTFQDIISAAQANQLEFVIMTEHPEQNLDTAEMTLKGTHGGVLFINGNEISSSTGERLLVIPGDSTSRDAEKLTVADLTNKAKNRGALTIAAYPDDFKTWDAPGLGGIEIYNVYTNARQISPLIALFDVAWSRRSYPALLFATFYERPSESIRKWDEVSANGRLTATAGNDAHANIGISLNDSSGNTILGLQLDSYETSFNLVRLHVLIPHDQGLNSESLMQSIKLGHCFIAFDVFGNSTGFSLTAENGANKRIQGDELKLQTGTRLSVEVPVSARVVLFKNGEAKSDETDVTSKTYEISETGVYRVEVYLPQLGKGAGEQPWIISNPIYVR